MCDLYGWKGIQLRVLTKITVRHLNFPTKSYDQIDERQSAGLLGSSLLV